MVLGHPDGLPDVCDLCLRKTNFRICKKSKYNEIKKPINEINVIKLRRKYNHTLTDSSGSTLLDDVESRIKLGEVDPTF